MASGHKDAAPAWYLLYVKHQTVMVWYGVALAPLWPPTTYKACQTPFICMKWIWYEYEVGSGWEVPIISYSMSPVRNHNKILRLCPPLLEWWYGMVLWHYDCQPWLQLLNTLYRYEVNLVWVWTSGWEIPIISYSMSPVRNPLKIQRLCPPLIVMVWYGVVTLWLPAMVEGF